MVNWVKWHVGQFQMLRRTSLTTPPNQPFLNPLAGSSVASYLTDSLLKHMLGLDTDAGVLGLEAAGKVKTDSVIALTPILIF